MNIRTRKIIIVALLLLLLLAFFSKSIIYWTTPKVTVTTVISGTITYTNQINASHVISDGMEKVRTPTMFPEGINVIWVIEGKQKSVTQGEVLLYVDETSLLNHVVAAEKKYSETLESIIKYKKNHPIEVENAIEELENAERNLKKVPNVSEKRARQYQSDYEIACDIYYQIVTLGMYESNSLGYLEKQRDLAQTELGILGAILDNQCAIRSPCDGTLISWPNSDTLTQLPANQVLFEILPDEMSCQLEISVQGDVYLHDESESVMLMNSSNPLDRLRFTVHSYEKKGEQTIIVLLSDEIDMVSCQAIEDYVLVYESPFYEALVPNNAFVSDTTVFAVQKVYTDNRIQSQLKEITVKKGAGNVTHTPVINGLTSGMLLVTAWDRNISDGDIVIVDGDEP